MTLEAELFSLRAGIKRLRAEWLLLKAGFNPAQPRDDHGRWTGGGVGSDVGDPSPDYSAFGGGSAIGGLDSAADVFGDSPDGTPVEGIADRRRATFPVDLRDEENDSSGHTMRFHVEKSDEALIERMEREVTYLPFGLVHFLQYNGSFSSAESANKIVSTTISNNFNIVEMVANGTIRAAKIETNFDSITGKEAYRATSKDPILMRETRAFSSEVDTTSREENATKQKDRAC